ncbi:MAG: putative kinesin family member 10 [Streblomastix strix]|uniref:Putative kinesin family member 10 n=1 Tax=Streblomastix strix TaxID=222440 RepID=A0A5J4W6B7_9EUKA|nr:MAG: putative kinesin family member 10 [Streblomastix strix]
MTEKQANKLTQSDNLIVAVREITGLNKARGGLGKRFVESRYVFDHVFDELSTQQEVFEGSSKHLILSLLEGYNCSIFAYGATGSGKTHTMIGNDSSGPGIMLQMLNGLFEAFKASEQENKFTVTVSFIEVYNENIRDLLDNSTRSTQRHKPQTLELREDPIRGVVVSGVSEHHPTSPNEVLNLLQQGSNNRATFGTNMNVVSSRSHAVMQVMIEAQDRGAGM